MQVDRLIKLHSDTVEDNAFLFPVSCVGPVLVAVREYRIVSLIDLQPNSATEFHNLKLQL